MKQNRSHLRWYLWVCLTLAVGTGAWWYNFYNLLLLYDITYLGFGCIALYCVTSLSIGVSLVRGTSINRGMVAHIAHIMPYLGILGTFIGMAYAFMALADLPADGVIPPEFKAEFLRGVMTKFFSSIVGVVCYIALETQLTLLPEDKVDDDDDYYLGGGVGPF